LTERHLPEIASVATLRVLIVDSSTLSDRVLEKHLGSRKDLRVVRSQRLWIEQLREFATQGGTVVAKRKQCVDLPALVDDLHRLQIIEISRQGTHYFVKGRPVPSDKLDIMHRISSVQYLDLSESDISDEQLPRLSELSDLRFLNLSATQLTGTTLEDLNRDSILRLDVSQTQLATSLPVLPNLELLIAREVIAESLFGSSGMPKLRALDVSGTTLTESDLEALVTFKALEHLIVEERYREHPAINQLVARKVSVKFN
jgi:Leucine-rich repeat (LRR) protein